VTPFNYIADEYATSPGALRQGIMGLSNQPKIGMSNNNSDTEHAMISSLSDMSVTQLEQMPIRIEMSVFLKELIEDSQMSKQFSKVYESLENANTKAVYAFIEMKRKEKKYPSELKIHYTEFASSFVINRKVRFVQIVKQCLLELCEVGVIQDCIYYDSTTSWKLIFEKIL